MGENDLLHIDVSSESHMSKVDIVEVLTYTGHCLVWTQTWGRRGSGWFTHASVREWRGDV